MSREQELPDIPELYIIKELVRKYMPAGHHLNSVDLSFGSLEDGQEPRFLVLVELTQETHAPEPLGWVDKLSKIIRQQWPQDNFYVKLNVVME